MTDRPHWLPERLIPFWDIDDITALRVLAVAEAVGEPELGQFAVCCVARTRADLGLYGHRIPEVCLWPYQFSAYWADFEKREADLDRALLSVNAYPIAQRVAVAVAGGAPDITGGATHYFNPDVCQPHWGTRLQRTALIGHHVFGTLMGEE